MVPGVAPAPKGLTRVLLIEDSHDQMQLVRCTLREYGQGRFDLYWANRLTDAVDRLHEGGVDLILLDLGLPESQGPSTYVALRNIAPHVPAIVLTGDESEQTVQLVMTHGAEDYLIKDEVSGLQLMRAIRSTIYRSQTRTHADF